MKRSQRSFGLASYTVRLALVSLAASIPGDGETHAAHDLLAISGKLAPDGGGAQLEGISGLTLNKAGHVAFRGTLKHGVAGVGPMDDKVVWTVNATGDHVVARASASNDAITDFQAIWLADDETVTFDTTMVSGERAVWQDGVAQPGVVRAATGGGSAPAVPGVDSASFESFDAPVFTSPGGVIGLNGAMTIGAGGVSTQNDRGAWVYDEGAGSLLAREAVTAAPGVPGGVFNVPLVSSVNDASQAAMLASLALGVGATAQNNLGVWRMAPEGGELLARRGLGNAPGASTGKFLQFEEPRINAGGEVVFRAALSIDGAAVSTGTEHGVWAYQGATGRLIARSMVGGVPNWPGANFESFSDAIINNAGQILIAGTLQVGVGGVQNGGRNGLWLYGPTEAIQLAAAGTADVLFGEHFETFGSLALSETGLVAVQANLQLGAAGVTPANRQGIWLFASDSYNETVVRAGEVRPEGVIASVDFHGGSGGGDGRQRALNANGQLAYKATFTDGREAAYLYTPDLHFIQTPTGSWDNADPWSFNLKPASVHAVTIAQSFVPVLVTGPASDTTVRQLTLGNTGNNPGKSTLVLQPNVTLTAREGTTIDLNGKLTGSGRIAGDVTNKGLVSPGASLGTLTIDGDYFQTPAGTLAIEIGGADNSNPLAPQYDQFYGSGVGITSGALSVSLVNGFVPSVGQSFEIVTFEAGFTGFSQMSLPALPGGLSWQPSSANGRVILNVIVGDPLFTADFDSSGVVDGADLTRWKNNFGVGLFATRSTGNTDDDGDVDGADFLAWQRQFGAAESSPSAIPEPSSGLIAAMLVLGLLARRPLPGRRSRR
jgi:hypothetical protein